MRDLAFACAWMVLFPISFWSPHIGILLWVWVALLSPNEVLYGFMAAVPFNKVVAFTTVVALVVSSEKKRFYLDGLLWVMVLFGLDMTMVWLFAPASANSDFLFDKMNKVFILVILLTGIQWSRHRLVMTCWVICISYGFLLVKEALIFLLTAGGHKVVGTGSTGDNNGLALAAIMTLPLMVYLAQTSALRIIRLGMWVVTGLSTVCVLATNSRGGLVGLCAVGLVLVGKSRHKVGAAIAVAVFAAVLVSVAPAEWFERINTIGEASEDSSFMTRVVAWKISLTMALDHPFGSGLFAVLQPANWSYYGARIGWLDFIPTPPVSARTFVAHSIYFQVMGDLGFLGLGLFLGMLGGAVLTLRRVKRLARRHPDLEWAARLGSMIELSLLGYIVAGAGLSLSYFEPLYILLAISSRLLQTCKETIRGELQYVAPRIRLPGFDVRPAVAMTARPAGKP